MSPNLHVEMISAQQNELAARTAQARVVDDCPDFTARRRRTLRSRACRATGALAVSLACLPFLTGTAAGKAGTVERLGKTSAASQETAKSLQVQNRIDSLEAGGYMPLACTTHGTLLINPHTGERAVVTW